MSDPKRLLEDGSDFERELLESARMDDPSPQRHRRLIAAAAATTATVAASTASGAGIAAWKVLVGLVLAGTVTTVAVTRTPNEELAVVDPPPPQVIAPAPVPFPTIAPSVLAPTPSAAPPAPSVAKAVTAPASASVAAPNLAREIALIDTARNAVNAHDGHAALTALDTYDRECRNGSLGIEAAVLRIEATALTGDKARASKLAESFLTAHPSSSYAPRVRKHL